MKTNKKIFVGSLMALSLLCLGACAEPVNSESSSSATQSSETSKDDRPELQKKHNALSLKEAIEQANLNGEEKGDKTYKVYGVVKAIENDEFGSMTLQDGSDELYVYGINDWKTMSSKPQAGDEIVVEGPLCMYKGKPELHRSTIIEVKKGSGDSGSDTEVDLTTYPAKTIKEARALNVDEKCLITGVVAKVTVKHGGAPDGFMLVDKTDSVYVYCSEAGSVKVGNTLKIAGKKGLYISSKETSLAEKFGYEGAIQVNSDKLVSNDGKVSEYDKSSFEFKSVKELINMPMTPNITGKIYSSRGYIHKNTGGSWVSYSIKDLDNETGSYLYSKDDGKDYAYLDSYCDKLVDFELSPINMKCETSKCFYRFIMCGVKESTYTPTDDDKLEYALNYKALEQFEDSYTSDPEKEMLTSVSNENLGLTDAKLSYASSDETVIKFENKDNKTIFHCLKTGTAKVTVTATLGEKTKTATKDISVKIVDVSGAVNVKAAIDSADQTTVLVKGVVMSATNGQGHEGFYLNDATGVICVRLGDPEALNDVHLGDLVYVSGTRTDRVYKDNPTAQILIENAEIVKNSYGKHEIDKTTFITDKTYDEAVAEIKAEKNLLNSTKVYVCKAYILSTQYSYQLKSLDPAKEDYLNMYAQGKGEYSWLSELASDTPEAKKELTVTFIYSDWNNKSAAKSACSVISVSDGTTTLFNDYRLAK